MATNGQVEVDDDSSASVKAEPGSEDKPGPTEGDDVDAGAEGLATLVVLVLDALDSGLAGTGPGCSHTRGLLEKGGPWPAMVSSCGWGPSARSRHSGRLTPGGYVKRSRPEMRRITPLASGR